MNFSICEECLVVNFQQGHYNDSVKISELDGEHPILYAMSVGQVFELARELGAMSGVTKR